MAHVGSALLLRIIGSFKFDSCSRIGPFPCSQVSLPVVSSSSTTSAGPTRTGSDTSSAPVPLFEVSMRELHTALLSKYTQYLRQNNALIRHLFHHLAEHILESYRVDRTRLDAKITSLEVLVGLREWKTKHRSVPNLSCFQRAFAAMGDFQLVDVSSAGGRRFSASDFALWVRVISAEKDFQERMDEVDELEHVFEQEYSGEKEAWIDSFNELEDITQNFIHNTQVMEVYSPRQVGGTTRIQIQAARVPADARKASTADSAPFPPERVRAIACDAELVSQRMLETREGLRDLQLREKLLGFSPNDLTDADAEDRSKLDSLSEGWTLFENFWSVADDWVCHRDAWMTEHLDKINTEQVKDFVERAIATMEHCVAEFERIRAPGRRRRVEEAAQNEISVAQGQDEIASWRKGMTRSKSEASTETEHQLQQTGGSRTSTVMTRPSTAGSSQTRPKRRASISDAAPPTKPVSLDKQTEYLDDLLTLATSLLAELKEFAGRGGSARSDKKKYLSVLISLRTPGMRPRHWSLVSKTVGFLVHPENMPRAAIAEPFSLRALFDESIGDFEQELRAIASQCAEEHSVETALFRILAEWDCFQLVGVDSALFSWMFSGDEERERVKGELVCLGEVLRRKVRGALGEGVG